MPIVGAKAYRFILRWGVAFVGICCGWLFDLIVLLCLNDTASHGLRDAGVLTLYFVAAWLLFGLPLAVWGPRLCSTGRIVLACIICGWLGTLIPVAILGGGLKAGFMAVLPFGRYFKVWLISFPPATISMLAYALIVRAIPRASTVRRETDGSPLYIG
jgi:hypothetical protein